MTSQKSNTSIHDEAAQETINELAAALSEKELSILSRDRTIGQVQENYTLEVRKTNKLAAVVSALKRQCLEKDLQIARLEGQIQGKTIEQRRVFDLANPLVTVSREDMQQLTGYHNGAAETPMGYTGLTNRDWLNVEDSLEKNLAERNRY